MAALYDINYRKNEKDCFVNNLIERCNISCDVANSIWNVLNFKNGEISENEYISIISSLKK